MNKKLKTHKKDCLIAVIFFILGLSTIYLLRVVPVENKNNFNSQMIKYCISSLEIANNINNNCSSAYKELGTCFANIDTCDIDKSEKRLQQLSKVKFNLEERLRLNWERIHLLIGNLEN